MANVHFLESGIGIAVKAAIGRAKDLKFLPQDLDIDKRGVISGIPEGERVRRFYMRMYVPEGSNLVLVQKDRASGQFVNSFLSPKDAEVEGKRYTVQQTMHPFLVREIPDIGWLFTAWDDGREYCANKVLAWKLGEAGQLKTWYFGVQSYDGRKFMVVDHRHWAGQLYMYRGGNVPEIVGKPAEDRFESFERLRNICSYGPFMRRLGGNLPAWQGSISDLDQPKLERPQEPNTAVLEFWERFMVGGQGSALAWDGRKLWVRGTEMLVASPKERPMRDLGWGSLIGFKETMDNAGAPGNLPVPIGVQVL